MKHVEIKRLFNRYKQGVLGILFINGTPFCVTLEPPDMNNEKNISCIPAASYICKPYSSPKYPDVYQVLDVPGRDYILFHAGNVVEHTNGCILLGESFKKFKHMRAIHNSGKTFDRFRNAMLKNNFNLTIIEMF